MLTLGYRENTETRSNAKQRDHSGSATPWTDFRKHARSGEHGADYARETMKCIHDWLLTLSPLDTQAEIEKAALGRQVFDWMLTLDEGTRYSCGWDMELLNFLARYLVAENEEEFFSDWLSEEMGSVPLYWHGTRRDEYESRYGWDERLLGSVAAVHLARRLDNGSIDAALRASISHESTRLKCSETKSMGQGESFVKSS